jgi:hypothetical protein
MLTPRLPVQGFRGSGVHRFGFWGSQVQEFWFKSSGSLVQQFRFTGSEFMEVVTFELEPLNQEPELSNHRTLEPEPVNP